MSTLALRNKNINRLLNVCLTVHGKHIKQIWSYKKQQLYSVKVIFVCIDDFLFEYCAKKRKIIYVNFIQT